MLLCDLLEVLKHSVNVKVVYFENDKLITLIEDLAVEVDSHLFLSYFSDWHRRMLKVWIEDNKLVILVE